MQIIARRMLLFLFVAVFVNLALAVPAQEAEQTDFSGTWRLNPEESDSMPGLGRPLGMGRGRRGGGGRAEDEGSQSREMTMVISQEGNVLNIFREGEPQGCADGNGPHPWGGTATVEAWWQGRERVVQKIQERQTPAGQYDHRTRANLDTL